MQLAILDALLETILEESLLYYICTKEELSRPSKAQRQCTLALDSLCFRRDARSFIGRLRSLPVAKYRIKVLILPPAFRFGMGTSCFFVVC